MPDPLCSYAVKLTGVSYSYAHNDVFTNLNWQVPTGITALMGPNGAGKTTLLKLLTGSLVPSAGIIESGGGQAIGEYRIGYLPQSYSFVTRMRAVEAVSHAAWSSGIPRSEVRNYAENALTQVNLLQKAKSPIKSLSGGQRQRLAIACALAPRPTLLLLDEPSVGLDPLQRRSLREVLASLGKQLPIVLSTHLVDDVVQLATSVTVLDQGRVLYSGRTVDLMGTDSLEDAYVRTVTQVA